MNTGLLKKALANSTVSPFRELLDYEYLYSIHGMTLKKISEITVGAGKLPSAALDSMGGLLDPRETAEYAEVASYVRGKLGTFDIAVRGTSTWPDSLADSERPAPILYYRGDLNLMNVPSVSVVGSRKASSDGLALAAKVAGDLVSMGYHVATGLAAGVDTAAATSALEAKGGSVIGVIGKPIDECYPKGSEGLHAAVYGTGGLLVSQVPFYRYSVQPFPSKKYYFPERNELMAAISDATFIVEASDTSGTLSQARACAHQGRPLFISRHCWEDPSVRWPRQWADRENVWVVSCAEEAVEMLEGGLLRGAL